MAYCKKCGNQLAEGARFCPKCGTKTTQSENMTEVSSSQSVNYQEDEKSNSSCVIKALKIAEYTILIVFIFGLIGTWFGDDDSQSTSSEEMSDNVYCEFSVKDLAGKDFHFILEDNEVGIGGVGMLTVKSGSEEAVSPFRWADRDSIIHIVLSNPEIEFLFPSGKTWESVVYDKKGWLYISFFSQKHKEADSRLRAVRKK